MISNKEESRRYRQQNVMAWVMFLNGIIMAWIAVFFIEPIGEIHGSVLGYIGTCFSVGGMMWGFEIWVSNNFLRREKPKAQTDGEH